MSDAEHLTGDEIAALIGDDRPGKLLAERAKHADTCDTCGKIIAMHQEENRRLHSIAGSRRRAPGNDCPALTEWAQLAAGLADDARQDAMLAHATQCDACGVALNEVLEDLSPDLTEAESRAIEALPSAQPKWQRELAGRKGRKWKWNPGILARAAAILVLAGSGLGVWVSQWFSAPARLLAQAYTLQRPFELRIPGADYAPVRLERRGTGSSIQRPAKLLEAEVRILEKLEKDPESVKWLGMRARAEMLAWDAEAAITTLLRALERKPEDPDLMADLGMAYALRAEAQDRSVDYGQAMEYLRRSLKAKPDSREAVFNLAIVYERMLLYDDAAREWQRYLDLDKGGPWREEAQRHLADTEQKKKTGSRP